MEPFAVPTDSVARNAFNREINIMLGKCVNPPIGCGRTISSVESASWDAATIAEYRISGWCNTCQDAIFQDFNEVDCCCINPCSEVDVGVGVITCATYHCNCDGSGDAGVPNFVDRIYEYDFEEYWRGYDLSTL